MDLSSVSTSYMMLSRKYSEFRAPSVEITVGSKKLVSGSKLSISNVDIELTSGYEASGAGFRIVSAYKAQKTDFESEVSCLCIGEKVTIAVGYLKREEVFTGYISEIHYRLEPEGFCIDVQCMDAKGLLMKNRRMEFFTEKSADAIVGKLLSESPVSTYISGKDLDKCSEEEITLRAHQMTDYEICCEQASKNGFEFFILQGKVFFRKRQKVTSTVMELEPGKGILSADLRLSGDSLVKTFEVRGIDQEKGEQIKGTVNMTGSFGKGGSKLLGSSKQVFYEAGIKDAAEAKNRATVRMKAAADKFAELRLECIGIPELAPGRFVKVGKLAKAMNGKYYITYVHHVIDADSFKTIVKAGADSL